jgi:hypothetical protein
VVDPNLALGEQLLDIAVGAPEAQVPADRKHDHLGGEAEASNTDRVAGAGVTVGQRLTVAFDLALAI